MREDGLDPAHYFTLPGLTLDSALKMTKVKLDRLMEEEQYEFVEKGIRGGFTFINQHYLHVNAEDIDPDSYNPNAPRHEMLYIDANNLYGHALSKLLPKSDFRWLSSEECSALEESISTVDLDGDTGFLLEVDLGYPHEIHDKTKDLPLAPEKLKINTNCLSAFMKEQYKRLSKGSLPKTYEKLLLTQWDKTSYVVHGKLLQFYLRQGMVLQKIRRGLIFKQDYVFREYISYNSSKRQVARNAFEKDFYKLKNNALYGKTVENVRRRMNFRICNSAEKQLNLASNPSYLSTIIFNESLTGVRLAKEIAVLDKPVFIGQAVLDLAKLEMYELYYDKLRQYENEFNCCIRLVGGDTDSFFLSVENCNVYRELLPAMQRDSLLDASNFAANHPLFSEGQKAKLGCVKDESEGNPYLEWVLLKPKAYSMLCRDAAGSKKRAKGVRRATVRKEITHELYRETFFHEKALAHSQKRIASNKHHMVTVTYKKVSLSIYEDKRHWLTVNQSLPYGHYSLVQERPTVRTLDTVPIHNAVNEETVDDTEEYEPPRQRRRLTVIEED
jgi:hypothetical protein